MTTIRSKASLLYVFLIGLNLGAWGLAFWLFSSRPLLLGPALLAYTFGLRHAVDADHISAIDNVTRKLMQDRKRPVGVGFFFSLGHSTVVIALTVGIALAASIVKGQLPALQRVVLQQEMARVEAVLAGSVPRPDPAGSGAEES